MIFLLFGFVAALNQFPITSSQQIIHVCDRSQVLYANPIQVIESCYSPYILKNITMDNIDLHRVRILSSANTYLPISGRMCFRLHLSTSCAPNIYLSENTATHTYYPEKFSSSECIGSISCINCDISEHYPPINCTTSSTPINKTILFQTNVIGYVNRLGVYRYQNFESISRFIELNDPYMSYIHFFDIEEHPPLYMSCYIDISRSQVIRVSDMAILSWTNQIVSELGERWAIFDDIPILIDDLPIEMFEEPIGPIHINMHFLNLQVDLNLHMNKRISCLFNQLKYNHASIMPVSFDDIGKIIDGRVLKQMKCSYLSIGALVNNGDCIYFTSDHFSASVSPSGEVGSPLGFPCTKNIRLNISHLLSVDSSGGLFIEENYLYSFRVGLEGPSKILSSITDQSLISDLVLNNMNLEYTSKAVSLIESAPLLNPYRVHSSINWVCLLFICLLLFICSGFLIFKRKSQIKKAGDLNHCSHIRTVTLINL